MTKSIEERVNEAIAKANEAVDEAKALGSSTDEVPIFRLADYKLITRLDIFRARMGEAIASLEHAKEMLDE